MTDGPEHEVVAVSTSFEKIILLDVLRQLSCREIETDHHHHQRKSRLISLPVSIWILLTSDFIIGQVIICPLVTLCWISAWLAFNWLLNDFLLPDNFSLATGVCVMTGIATTNGLGLVTPVFHKLAGINDDRQLFGASKHFRFFFFSRFYTLIEFLTSMVLWKGWWELCRQMGTGFTASIFLFTSSCLCLICLRKLHSIIGFPFNVSIDNPENYKSVGRRLKSELQETWMNEWIVNVINCTVTTLIDILTISSWYGIWTLEDNLANIISDQVTHSAVLSLVIGFTTGASLFIVQFVALLLDSRMATEARTLFRVFVGDCLASIALISTVSNLRGFWIILDIYIPVAHHPLYLSGLFLSAFLVLTSMGCVSSLHGGKVPDATQGILLPGFYLTFFAVKKAFKKVCNDDTGKEEEDAERLQTNLMDNQHSNSNPRV